MGRTVTLEEEESKRLISSGREGSYTGLLIGQTTEQKDYVALIIPTPSLKAISGGEKLEVGDDWWVEEHSKQVSRMLAGGLAVVGILLCCQAEQFKAQQARARALLKKMLSHPQLHGLLLHLCSKTKKLKCFSFELSDTQGSMRPTDMKVQAFVSSWRRLETLVTVDINAYITGAQKTLESTIHFGLEPTFQSICSAVGTINGQIYEGDFPLSKIQGSSAEVGATLPVKLYLVKSALSSACTMMEPTSSIHVSGQVHCYAYVHAKATFEEAMKVIKKDLELTILHRCLVFCSDSQEEEKDQQQPSTLRVGQLPQRIQVTLKTSPLALSDYCFPDEEDSECRNRVSELFGTDPLTIMFQPLEGFITHSVGGKKPTTVSLSPQLPSNNVGRRNILPWAGIITAMTLTGAIILAWVMQN